MLTKYWNELLLDAELPILSTVNFIVINKIKGLYLYTKS